MMKKGKSLRKFFLQKAFAMISFNGTMSMKPEKFMQT